jgi:hypothetical protein
MTNETRRRQMLEELRAKARQMQEDDRRSRLETIRTIDRMRRDLKPYSPESFAAKVRSLFGDEKRKATIGK